MQWPIPWGCPARGEDTEVPRHRHDPSVTGGRPCKHSAFGIKVQAVVLASAGSGAGVKVGGAQAVRAGPGRLLPRL